MAVSCLSPASRAPREGQEDQEALAAWGGVPLALSSVRVPPGPPSGSSLGSLAVHQSILSYPKARKVQRGPEKSQEPFRLFCH